MDEIELRAVGKFFGSLSPDGRLFAIKRGPVMVTFDLWRSVTEQRAVICRLVVDDAPAPDERTRLDGCSPKGEPGSPTCCAPST